jgi:DNA-binding beta-propeller fold protein YncE
MSTASYSTEDYSISSEDSHPLGICFNGDGTALYMLGRTNDKIYQYDLSSAFDLTTISYSGISLSVATQGTDPVGIAISPDGTKLYISEPIVDKIFQYSMFESFTATVKAGLAISTTSLLLSGDS